MLIQSIEQFFWSISLINISLWVILITAGVYLFLHGNRHHHIFAQLSIIAGFIPILIHELGHAVTASVTKGRVTNIYMVLTPGRQRDEGRQGYTETASRNPFSSMLVTFAGYAFPSLMFVGGVFLAVHGYSIIFMGLFTLLFVYYLVHTSQKWLPFLIIILLTFVIINMAGSFSEWIDFAVSTGYNIVLGLLLGEIIQSILLTARVTFKRGIEWDGTAMKRLTHVPVSLWWLIWSAISIWSIYQSWQLISAA
jgi:hypothetical protein